MSKLESAARMGFIDGVSACIARLERYSMEHVEKLSAISGAENAQAQGWALLVAAQELRKLYPPATVTTVSAVNTEPGE